MNGNGNERLLQTRRTDELFVRDERFSIEADADSVILISIPARFTAVLKKVFYQVVSSENPANAFQVFIPERLRENAKDVQLSPDGSIYLIRNGDENNKTLHRLNRDTKLYFERTFQHPINMLRFSPSGKYVFILTGFNFLNVLDVESNKLVTQEHQARYGRLSSRLFKFSPDEKSVLFIDSEFDRCLYKWSFLEDGSPIEKVYEFEETICEFVLHPNNRLLAYAKRYQNTVVVRDLRTKKSINYNVGSDSIILSFAGDGQCLYVLSYNDSHWLNLRVYTLDDSELKGFLPFGEDVQQLFVDTQGNLLITRQTKTQKYVLNQRSLSLSETVTPHSLRKILHLKSFELLRAGYRVVQPLIKEKAVKSPAGVYYINSRQDWLKFVGHFATAKNKTKKDVDKDYLAPCSLIIGPENNIVTINAKAIVQFAGAGESYAEISEFLEQMLAHPDNEIRATDFYQLLMRILERELLRNHRDLAEVLLRRIATNAPYPENYTLQQKIFLDALLVLMIIVEGSRNNVSVLTTILLLDVISNHVFIDASYKIYSFCNSFAKGSHEWEGPFKGGQGVPLASHNRGGFFPMAANATGSRNFSERRIAVEGFPTFYGTQEKVDVSYFVKRPQKHHVLLQEVKLMVDWILWFHADKVVADPMKRIATLFQQRLGQVFQFPNANVLLNQLVNAEAIDDSYSIPGSIDRNQHHVVCVSHENTTTRTITLLSYFHELHRPCSNVPEHVVNGEEKELIVSGGAKHKFKSKSYVATVNPSGITRSIQGPSVNRVIECNEGVIKIYDQRTVLLNDIPAQVTSDDLNFMWECLARIYEFRLTYINREELEKYFAKNTAVLSRYQGLLQCISNNIAWRKNPSLKNQVVINFREVKALVGVYDINPEIEVEINDEDRVAIVQEVTDLLLRVTRLKNSVWSTDLAQKLFSPELESMSVEIEFDEKGKMVGTPMSSGVIRLPAMSKEEIARMRDHPVLNILFRKLLESHETYEFNYTIEGKDDLEPCPECFGRRLQSQFLAIPKYGTPCYLDEEKKRYHVLDSACINLLQKEGLRVSYINDSLQETCLPCEQCWTILTHQSQMILTPLSAQVGIFAGAESPQKKLRVGVGANSGFIRPLNQVFQVTNPNYWYQSDVLQKILVERIKQYDQLKLVEAKQFLCAGDSQHGGTLPCHRYPDARFYVAISDVTDVGNEQQMHEANRDVSYGIDFLSLVGCLKDNVIYKVCDVLLGRAEQLGDSVEAWITNFFSICRQLHNLSDSEIHAMETYRAVTHCENVIQIKALLNATRKANRVPTVFSEILPLITQGHAITRNARIIVPLNKNNRHWVSLELVLFYSEATSSLRIEIFQHDPFGIDSLTETEKNNLTQKLTTLLRDEFNLEDINLEYKSSEYDKRQHDATSCGAITCEDILLLAQGLSLNARPILAGAREIRQRHQQLFIAEGREMQQVPSLGSCEKRVGNSAEKLERYGLFLHEKKDSPEKQNEFTQTIPEEFSLGEAKGKGDFFYDSCAQELNELSGREEYTIKSLRLLCHEYTVALDKHCSGNPNHPDNWIGAFFNDPAKYQQYLANVRYTVEEREAGEGIGNDRLAIRGEQHLDGRIICEKLGIKLHVVEVCENPDEKINKKQKFGTQFSR